MIFENLPTTPRSEELIDKAFSRAARAGRAKSGHDAQTSMLQTASNILSDNLENVVTAWPDFDEVDPFYYELADAIVDVDEVRKSLSEVTWASRKTAEIRSEYEGRMRRNDLDTARKFRKQAFARLADVVEEVEDDLLRLGAARDELKTLPDINPDEPAIVVAGYPNVGKSSFVNAVTRARHETATYPFTTKGIGVGHFERQRIRYQIVDTPGLLDRPPQDRNDIEAQAVSALTHLADCVLFVLDASANCGYPLDDQLELLAAVEDQFGDVPVITVCNKSDVSRDVEADYYMSVTEDENLDTVLDAAVDAIGYEPELPFDG
ncbi:NOG1 family protein [Haloarchaeobius sp. HME9146]|uniref:NOG1 family protein n=1 Tax=Haloarchaeobius sp. HME9146 TaxID=2978732 RepID=UPI0021C209EB|nr:NOG1 family protein [Haloarchaeobius sp. HME9146]MCT9095432.1 NOG1 family protein [Haloarchaeobius sp. HME9146]